MDKAQEFEYLQFDRGRTDKSRDKTKTEHWKSGGKGKKRRACKDGPFGRFSRPMSLTQLPKTFQAIRMENSQRSSSRQNITWRFDITGIARPRGKIANAVVHFATWQDSHLVHRFRRQSVLGIRANEIHRYRFPGSLYSAIIESCNRVFRCFSALGTITVKENFARSCYALTRKRLCTEIMLITCGIIVYACVIEHFFCFDNIKNRKLTECLKALSRSLRYYANGFNRRLYILKTFLWLALSLLMLIYISCFTKHGRVFGKGWTKSRLLLSSSSERTPEKCQASENSMSLTGCLYLVVIRSESEFSIIKVAFFVRGASHRDLAMSIHRKGLLMSILGKRNGTRARWLAGVEAEQKRRISKSWTLASGVMIPGAGAGGRAECREKSFKFAKITNFLLRLLRDFHSFKYKKRPGTGAGVEIFSALNLLEGEIFSDSGKPRSTFWKGKGRSGLGGSVRGVPGNFPSFARLSGAASGRFRGRRRKIRIREWLGSVSLGIFRDVWRLRHSGSGWPERPKGKWRFLHRSGFSQRPWKTRLTGQTVFARFGTAPAKEPWLAGCHTPRLAKGLPHSALTLFGP